MRIKTKKTELLEKLDHVRQVNAKQKINEDRKLVTLQIEDGKAVLICSNGFMDAEIFLLAQIEEKGTATVDSDILLKVIKSTGGKADERQIELSLQGTKLVVTDLESSARKNYATTETFPSSLAFKVPKSFSPVFEIDFEPEVYCAMSKICTPFAAKTAYNPELCNLAICPQGNSMAFVAGDGMLFCVATLPLAAPVQAGSWFLPAPQAAVIANIASGSRVSIKYRSPDSCLIALGDQARFKLRGIVTDNYVDWKTQLDRVQNAKMVIDVPRQEILSAFALADAVRDKDASSFQTLRFKATDNLVHISVDGKHSCEFSSSAELCRLAQDVKDFEASYAAIYFHDVATSVSREFVRFYCTSPSEPVVAEVLDLVSDCDPNGIRLRKEEGAKVQFFFVSFDDSEGNP